MPLFADVILPLPLSSNYTYSIPKEYEERISVGCRVTVPLGKSKHYTALVAKVHDEEPREYETRPITELLDDSAIVLPLQMRLWEWIARYYVCSLGEIFKAAVPQGLKGEFKPKTEQRIRLTKRIQDTIAKNLIEQSLSRAPRQKRLFNTFLQLTQNGEEVSRHKLIEIAEVTPNICKELIDKGIFECYEVEIGRLQRIHDAITPPNALNDAQQKALDNINDCFKQKM